MRGVVAAGHPVTAEAGADALRAGGNAVDAALAAMFASFVAEPMLTGLGAGGYMLVAPPGEEPVLLDFFVEAPGRGLARGRDARAAARRRRRLRRRGPGVQHRRRGGGHVRHRRRAPRPRPSASAAAARRARRAGGGARARRRRRQRAAGVPVRDPRADHRGDAGGARALHAGRPAAARRARSTATRRSPTRSSGSARRAPAPFYTGDVAAAVCAWVADRGGLLTRAGPRRVRAPSRARRCASRYRGDDGASPTRRRARAGSCSPTRSRCSSAARRRRRSPALVDAMEAAQARAHAGVPRRAVRARASSSASRASRLGATTHISAVDGDGWACAVTCTNGEGCGEVVPGTGIHLNNMMGEQDLSPFGFHAHPPGRRLPSMMAPTMVLGDGGAAARARLGRLQPDPLGDPAGRRSGCSTAG